MKIKDCMCNDICCVTPNTKIYEVAKLMEKNSIGSIPVIDENEKLCGIITDRDIILRTVACNKDTTQTPVSDIMTTKVCTCMENEDIKDAECKMSEYQIRRLPVCDTNNKVVGIITLGDLAQNTEKIGTQNICTTVANICNCNNKNDK